MDPSDNSLHDVLQELMRTHANSVEILSKFSQVFTSSNDSVTVNLTNNDGQIQSFQVPSLGYLQETINRIEENMKSLSGMDNNNATMRLADGTYKKVIASGSLKEPNRIGSLTVPTTFTRRNNYFFENFINPMLIANFDVTPYVTSDVRSVWYRRVIINTDSDEVKQVFDDNIKGRNDVEYESLMLYLSGKGITHFVDEDEAKFPPSISHYSGTFDVISTLNLDTSSAGKSRTYRLNKLSYTDNQKNTKNTETLKIGDILSTKGGTRYRVEDVNKSDNTVKLIVTSGYELISIGTDVLFIVSDILTLRQVEVPIGHDERQVVFFRPVNDTTNVASTKWSPGVAFWSNDLRIRTSNTELSLNEYYNKYCIDFGSHLLDTAKNKPIPSIFGQRPSSPTLKVEDYKVVIVNEHKRNSKDVETLRQKFSDKERLASEISQLDSNIAKTKEELQTTNFRTDFDKRVITDKLNNLINQKNSLTTLYNTTVREMASINVTNEMVDSPKYRVRGFFAIPSAKFDEKTGAQNIIQFIIQYRYRRIDGTASGPKSFEFVDDSGNTTRGYYSEWTEVTGPLRKQVYDNISQSYVWATEDVNDADAVNINQVDIPITPGEQVEFRVASISEAGYPVNPLRSEFSDSIVIEFPNELVSTDERKLLEEAQLELNKVQILDDLNSKGLNVLLSSVFTQGDTTFTGKADTIASGYNTQTGSPINVFDKFKEMEMRIQALQEMVTAGKGRMDVYLLDENNNRYTISNGASLELNAGYYTDIVQQLPESERKGAIITAKYCIVIENINPTPLELITRFPGGINQSLKSLFGVNNTEYQYRNYHTAPVLYNDIPFDQLKRDGNYWPSPYMSNQVPSQFMYVRERSLGLNETDKLFITSSQPVLLPTNPSTPTGTNGFIWAGSYTGATPNTTTVPTEFCIHVDHPEVKDQNKSFIQLVNPDIPAGTSQVIPRIRHSAFFNLQINETDGNGLKQLSADRSTPIPLTAGLVQSLPTPSTVNNYPYKLGFYPNDRYLIGKKTCGSYLMIAPASTKQMSVDGTDYRANYKLEQGEDKAIRIPVIFQYRMTDYYGSGSNGTGVVGGWSTTQAPTNLTYGKKIGLDIYVKDEGIFSFDLLIKASYTRESLTQVVQSPGFIDRTRRAVQDFFKT